MAQAWYLPVAFSDHFGLITKMSLTDPLAKILSPKCRSQFRLSAEVIKDRLFKERLDLAMDSWQGSSNLGVLQWWELLVKPGIKRLGIERTKEIGKVNYRENMSWT